MTTASVRYGVAGWAYDDWNGIVYPQPRPRGFKPLAFLMNYFDALEINSSFYAIPAPHVALRWAQTASANSGFEFTMKLWQGFTHQREKWDEPSARAFDAAAAPLFDHGVLGAVLVQFPWSFKPQPQSISVLERILDRFAHYPLAVEVRHSAWLDGWDGTSILDILQPRGVAFCNIDQPRLNQCLGMTRFITAPHAYLRAHGRNAANWFQEQADRNSRYDYLYAPGEIEELAAAVRALKEKARKVHVITNNHLRGQAVANALQIEAAVEGKAVSAPAQLLKAFGGLGPYVLPEQSESGQMEMF